MKHWVGGGVAVLVSIPDLKVPPVQDPRKFENNGGAIVLRGILDTD